MTKVEMRHVEGIWIIELHARGFCGIGRDKRMAVAIRIALENLLVHVQLKRED